MGDGGLTHRSIGPVSAFARAAGPEILDPLSAPEYYNEIRRKRVFAYLVDICVIVLLNVLWWLPGALFSVISLFTMTPFFVAGSVLLPFIYHTYFIGSDGNATLGMRWMGVRVAAWNGRNPGYLQALVQTTLFYATVPTTQGLVLLVSLFNDRGRCLHDILCGTVVVNVVQGPVLEQQFE